MTSVPSLPPPGSFISAVRHHPWHLEDFGITIDDDAIRSLLRSVAFKQSFHRLSSQLPLSFPLAFPSIAAEVNLISLASILNFASGYRIPLRSATGRGAWDTIRYLAFSLFLDSTSNGEGGLLSSKGLFSINEAKVASLLNLNLHVDKPHPTLPGVFISELGGPLHELVQLITRVLNETGSQLLDQGYPDLGSLIIQIFNESAKTPETSAEFVVEKLVTAIPSLRDMALVEGKPIYIFKKAIFLTHAIVQKFGRMYPAPFYIPDGSDLPIMSDNVNPSMLIYFGVLNIQSSRFKDLFPSSNRTSLHQAASKEVIPPVTAFVEGPILNADNAFILRAGAIDACERIVQVAQSLECPPSEKWINSIRPFQLDMWLWSVAKDRPDYRALPRFAERGTSFY